MDGLRLILLLVGALIIGGVYLYSRRGAGKRREPESFDGKREPGVSAGDGIDEDLDDLPPLRATDAVDDPVDAPGAGPVVKQPAKGADAPRSEQRAAHETRQGSGKGEKIIVLNILPRESGNRFPGNDLLDVFDRAGLEYGRFDVFHRIKETADGPQSVFVVASATEPGSFDVTEMADQSFKGLSMFMVLPGPARGVDAFADMLATARRIAQQLDADVKDRNRSTLTKQTAHHIREEIIAFEHSISHQHS